MMVRKRVVLLMTTLCLLLGLVNIPTYAKESDQGKNILEPISLGTVTLRENVTATVKNVMMLPADNNQAIGLTLTINNNSGTEINFLDYWVNLSTKAGAKINVQVVNKDLTRIPAKSEVDINFYGAVGNNIKLSDLIISVIKWDFSTSNYTKVLGKIFVPQRYNPTTPAGNGRTIVSDQTKVSLTIKQATIGKSEKFYRPDIKIMIRNNSKRSISLPDYQLFIMTKNNIMYPVKAANIKGTNLNPLTEKEFQLTVSIPIEVQETGWKLAVFIPIDEGKNKFPLGLFELPNSNVNTAEEIGKYYTFTNSEGVYYVKIDSLNRLPIEDDDLIIANLTLANKGTETLPMPTLNGKYVFNETIQRNASSSSNSKQIAMQPNSEVQLQMVGRIPYTFDISKINFILQQKETGGEPGSENSIDLVEFTNSGVFNPIQKVSWEKGFKISEVGYRANVKARNKMTYSADTADIVAVQLLLTNEERRLADAQKLAGYFEKTDGTIYPANFENVSEKLNPGGSAIINAWSSIPKGLDTNDMRLVVGKAITESTSNPNNNQGEPSTQLVGYTNPYSFNLPNEFVPQQSLQKIDLQHFELNINRVATQINFETAVVKLNFDYELIKDILTKTNIKDDKLIIELRDDNQVAVFTKELAFPNESSGDGNQTSNLQMGKNTIEMSWTNEKLAMGIQLLKDYEFNVYHQIKPGYKKLIATQKVPWLVNRTVS